MALGTFSQKSMIKDHLLARNRFATLAATIEEAGGGLDATLEAWIGRRERATDCITVPLVHRLAATLDRDDPMPRHGDP
ncbi:MAG TPA: hypothetical protein VIQ62_05550, partial [Burkholderiales bacterium]